MKMMMMTIMSAVAISSTVMAGPRLVLSAEQAKEIAIIQVRAANVKDDVLTVVRSEVAPAYSALSAQHLSDSKFQVQVQAMRPGQTCLYTIVIDDSSGDDLGMLSTVCE